MFFPYEIDLLIRSFLFPDFTVCIKNKSIVQDAIRSKFLKYVPITGEKFVQPFAYSAPNYICQLKYLVDKKLRKRGQERIISDITNNLHQLRNLWFL